MNALIALMMVMAVSVFFIGFHNLDIAWNMASGCLDTGMDSIKRSRPEIYRLSLLQLFTSAAMFVVTVFSSNVRVNKI